jgi:hypothetical protein
MNTKIVGLLAVVGAIVIAALMIVGMGINYSNAEIDLRNQASAQQDSNRVIYDKVWKTIKQKAEITDKYANDFKDIYVSIMNERYEGDTKGSPMFKWIQEQNPNFSVDMYKGLSDAIEANRAEFTRVQMRLRDIKREHDNLRLKFPGSLFVGKRPELEIKLVTSTVTENVFETKKEDDVDLFKR